MTAAFTLTKCQSEALWQALMESSPHHSIFSDPRFLATQGVSYDTWFVYRGATPVLGALVMHDASNVAFKTYHGIELLSDGSVIHRAVKQAADAISFLGEQLTTAYKELSFCLHPKFPDMRPLQWVNYHTPERGRFQVELLYTGRIHLASYATFDAYVDSTRNVRQSELKKARKGGLESRNDNDIDAFMRLYTLTFGRQAITLAPRVLSSVRYLAQSSVDGGWGRLMFCRDSHGNLLAATLFLHDKSTAYYMFGATDPEYRNTGASTYLIYENIRHFYDARISEIDMVGINSPNRGDFKVSFNARPVPYFTAAWRQPFI